VKGGRRERLTAPPPSVSLLSRKFGCLDDPNLWASTARYRDSFILLLHYMLFLIHLSIVIMFHGSSFHLLPLLRRHRFLLSPFSLIDLSLFKFSVTVPAGYPIWFHPLCGLPIILAFFHIADNIWDRFSVSYSLYLVHDDFSIAQRRPQDSVVLLPAFSFFVSFFVAFCRYGAVRSVICIAHKIKRRFVKLLI
jgi:hypothetical protein